MKLLLDKSALKKYLVDPNIKLPKNSPKNENQIANQVWVFSEDVASIIKTGKKNFDKPVRKKLSSLLSCVAVIPLRAFMLEKVLCNSTAIEEYDLVQQAAASVDIDAIVTCTPEDWEDCDYPTFSLSDLVTGRVISKKSDTTTVPFLDLKIQLHQFYNKVDWDFHEIIHNTGFILGPHVQSFEKNFADIHNIGHCLGVSTGTDALHIALLALGIGQGDRVIVPVNTFIATAEAVSLAGAEPVFVDCDEYWNISVDHCRNVLDKINRRGQVLPKAIIPVHLYGQSADMTEVLAVADEYGMKVVEDCAQAHLACWQGRQVGSFGEFGAFSFYPGKNLGAFGEAGAVVTKEKALFDKALLLRQHGETKKYHHQVVGHNYRMSALQGAALGAKLPFLTSWTKRRCINARLYDGLLTNIAGIEVPKVRNDANPVYHLYVIQAEEREALADFLNTNGVATGFHYPVPLHLQPAYADLGYKHGEFPVAEKAASQLLSLPIYPELSKEKIEYVCRLIREFALR